MSKFKRTIASLLVALNILTIMPLVNTEPLIDEAYASGGSQIGTGDGVDKVVLCGVGGWVARHG